MKTYERWILTLVLVLAGAAFGMTRYTQAQATEVTTAQAIEAQHAHQVTLYLSPTFVCCGKWGDHLRESGFEVREEISDDVIAIVTEYDVPEHLLSCHMGLVDGYALVGHVPADLAARLLSERPEVTGIAVPGMPLGSSGMEALGRKDRYDVTAFGPGGVEYVYDRR